MSRRAFDSMGQSNVTVTLVGIMMMASSKCSVLMRNLSSLCRIRSPCRSLTLRATTGTMEPDSKWIKSYDLNATGIKNRCVTQTEDGHEITTDVPKSMGGQDSGPQPVYLLLSAMVGCETSTAHFVARKMGIKIDSLSFKLHAWRDQRGVLQWSDALSPSDQSDGEAIPSMLQEIKGEVTVHSSSTLSQEQVDILAREVKKRCPVASMITSSGCRVDVKWKLGV